MAHSSGAGERGWKPSRRVLALALAIGVAGVGQALAATPVTPSGSRARGAASARPRGSASAPHARWSKTAPVETPSPSTCVANEGTASVDSPGCRSLTSRVHGQHFGLGISTVFLQPIDQSGTPPALLGAAVRGFVSLPVGRTVDLRFGPSLSLASSSRGVVAPLGVEVEPIFQLTPEVFWGVSLTAGVLVGPRYRPAADQPAITPSPFAMAQLTPFGFRFGERSQGELGVRFGLMVSELETAHERSWALSFGSASVWLNYVFSTRP